MAELVERVTAGADDPEADRAPEPAGRSERVAGAGAGPDLTPRPIIERIGLGAIALILAVTFGGIAAAALASGEVFLGVMAGIGALMTLWAAASTLRRG